MTGTRGGGALTWDDLPAHERAAVDATASRMAAWHDAHVRPGHDHDNQARYATGQPFCGDTTKKRPTPPDAAIVQLRREGVIDAVREHNLTALAFRMSLRRRTQHGTGARGGA